jgi:hypothetical protein
MRKTLLFAAVGVLAVWGLSPTTEARARSNGLFGIPLFYYLIGQDRKHQDGDAWYGSNLNGDLDYYHRESDLEVAYSDVPAAGADSHPRSYIGKGSNDHQRYIDYEPRHHGSLTCSQARRLVDRSGYDKVHTVKCNKNIYVFRAENRRGNRVEVRVNSRTRAVW